jgi:hypothetical protein
VADDGARVRVSRSLHWAALFDAIERQRSVLAAHDWGHGSAPPCCAPGSRCGAYQQSARRLARYERSKAALLTGLFGRERAGEDAEPEAASQSAAESTAPAASVFRCAQCGDGTQLRGWVHLNAHGPVGADGKIERYDYESEDAHEIIEESVTCRIHGEDFIEKLADGQYASVSRLAMANGRYVTGPRAQGGGVKAS